MAFARSAVPLGVAVALAAAIGQNAALLSAWRGCDVGGPVLDDFPGGAAYVGLLPFAARIVVYGLLFGGTAAVAHRRRLGTAAVLCIALAACGLLFALDFAWCVGMDAGTYDPARCPGGRPSWFIHSAH